MGNTAEVELVALLHALHATGYAFVTPTPASHARVLARPGRDWAMDLRDVLGWSLPVHDGVLDPSITERLHAAGVVRPVDGGWRSTVRVSTLDGLSFLHSAYPTRDDDAVFFGPDTYRFGRAILQHIAQRGPVQRAVDIGCGAGPGAILIGRSFPDAEVVGADINAQALRLTRANAAAAGVRVHAVHSDILSAVPGTFDLITANPPYLVDPAQRAYRHGGGLLGAGLSLRILDQAVSRLAPGGTMLLYTGAAVVNGEDPFRAAASARLTDPELNWHYDEIDPDVFGEELDAGAYTGADRIAAILLTVHKPG